MSDRVSQLESENESLKLRVAWLEGELGLAHKSDAVGAIMDALRLTTTQARIVCALARAYPRAVQTWAIAYSLLRESRETDCAVKVHVNRIRRTLGETAIITADRGYKLDTVFAAKVQAITMLAARAA